MSGAEFDGEFLYNLPACVMNDFTRVMDSLSHSDWMSFGKIIIFVCGSTATVFRSLIFL